MSAKIIERMLKGELNHHLGYDKNSQDLKIPKIVEMAILTKELQVN